MCYIGSKSEAIVRIGSNFDTREWQRWNSIGDIELSTEFAPDRWKLRHHYNYFYFYWKLLETSTWRNRGYLQSYRKEVTLSCSLSLCRIDGKRKQSRLQHEKCCFFRYQSSESLWKMLKCCNFFKIAFCKGFSVFIRLRKKFSLTTIEPT